MLINLSNHPSELWSSEQYSSAVERFGSVKDIPFPAVDPAASLAAVDALVKSFTAMVMEQDGMDSGNIIAVHVMGEFCFTYSFVKEMQKHYITCVASTTERHVKELPDGSKKVVFKFIQFRPYF